MRLGGGVRFPPIVATPARSILLIRMEEPKISAIHRLVWRIYCSSGNWLSSATAHQTATKITAPGSISTYGGRAFLPTITATPRHDSRNCPVPCRRHPQAVVGLVSTDWNGKCGLPPFSATCGRDTPPSSHPEPCVRHVRLARTLNHRSSGLPMHRRTSLTIQPASVSADVRADSRQYVST